MFFNGKTNSSTERVISRSRRFRVVSTGAFCALAILTLLAVFPIAKHKEDAEATTVPATTSLSIISSKDTASVDITPTSKDGTFAISAAADQAEFSVTTDNLTGYSVTLLGSDTSGQLVNNITGDTLDTITSNTTESDFRTGSASTYANKWGYRLNVNNTTTTDFMAAPTTNTAKTIYSTNAPNTTGTSDNFTLALGARVDYEKQTGTYTNTFVLTAVANSISYQINYLDADGTTQLLPSDAESNISASSIELNSTAPTKSGYNFLGWCDGTLSSDGESCTGTTYQPGDTYTFASLPSTGTVTADLYAMWEAAGAFIQNLDPTLCTSTPRTVIDKRDGQEYIVQRLTDGNCWMMTNLNLGATTLTQDLTSANTNLATTISASDFNSWKKTTGSLSYSNGEYISVSGTDSTSLTPYGTLYNYYVASAGTISGNNNTSNATYDICPAGWRLPVGGSSGEFAALYALSDYNSFAKLHNSITNGGAAFALAGYVDTGNPYPAGETWDYWSSTRYSSTEMYDFNYHSSAISTAYRGNRGRGMTIRCVRKQTMQSFSNQAADAMATNSSLTLEDERDGQTYTVKKLGDGNVWMTRNLAIGCNGTGSTYGSALVSGGTSLTPADSNINSNWTLPDDNLSLGDTNDYPRMACSTTYGAWYNYPAASTGLVTGSAVSVSAEYDICPKGWRLPTVSEEAGILSYSSTFNPVYGGYYQNKSIINTNRGYWWSSNVNSNGGPYILRWMSSTLTTGGETGTKYLGMYVRCVKDNQTMQSFTGEQATMMATNETKTLKDARDGQTYTVKKLGDGNVWMTKNLAIGCKGDNYNQVTLTSADSNVAANYTTSIDTLVGKTNSYDDDYMTCSSTYGAWYNYVAASAKTITGSNNTDPQIYDVCPKGWRMPSASEQSGVSSYISAYSPIAGGNYYNGSSTGTSYGFWWSSTSADAVHRNYMRWDNSSGVFLSTAERPIGLYVRCIKDQQTMQSFTSAQESKMAASQIAVLKDERDGQDYSIAKIGSKVWMTRNLAIGCDGSGTTYSATPTARTLTPGDTNIAANHTTSTGVWAYSDTDPEQTCDATYGAWYNYVAATGGTILGPTNNNDATYDICPLGWRMPNSTEISNVIGNQSLLKATLGGRYYDDGFISGTNNGFGYTTYGIYWSSTKYSSTGRYWLGNNNGTLYTPNGDYGPIDAGFYIRCVPK